MCLKYRSRCDIISFGHLRDVLLALTAPPHEELQSEEREG